MPNAYVWAQRGGNAAVRGPWRLSEGVAGRLLARLPGHKRRRQDREATMRNVRAMLEGMLLEMHRLKHPDDVSRPITLRGLSWIVNPYEDGGVVVAIEITLGAAIAGPFDISQQALEAMITRVMARARKTGGKSETVH